MGSEIILPKQGIYSDDVELIEWLVAEGSEVSTGDPIFVLGTDKVDSEVSAEDTGWVQQLVGNGFQGPIGTTVGFIHESREDYHAARGGAK